MKRTLKDSEVAVAEALLVYLEGNQLSDEQQKLISTCKETKLVSTVYRTIGLKRKANAQVGLVSDLRFNRPLISVSSTAEASLLAAKSYNSDYELGAKYFAVYELSDVSVLLNTEELQEYAKLAPHPRGLSHILDRIQKEKELIIVGGRTYSAKLLKVN